MNLILLVYQKLLQIFMHILYVGVNQAFSSNRKKDQNFVG
jgi:hypothetical protein